MGSVFAKEQSGTKLQSLNYLLLNRYRLSQTNYTPRNVFEHLSTAGSTESTAVRLLQPHSSDVESNMKFVKSKSTLTAMKITQELIMKSFKLMIPAESDCEDNREFTIYDAAGSTTRSEFQVRNTR